MFFIFLLTTSAHSLEPRPDFIEAQMGFAKSASSQNPTCRWSSEDQRLEVDFMLTWQNFEEPLHTGGFKMDKGISSYLVFPVPNEGCTYLGGYGEIPPPPHASGPQVSLLFQGSTCRDVVERLNVGTLVVHFYDVPSYLGDANRTPVLRLQIWDHFTVPSCSE